MVLDLIKQVNEDIRKRHINQCRKCKYVYPKDFCTVFQKNINDTSFECDGTDEIIDTIL